MRDGTATKDALTGFARLRAMLPAGVQLAAGTWQARHRFIVTAAAVHAPLLALFGWSRGWSMAYWLTEGALIAALAWIAWQPAFSRRLRSAIAALAMVTSSAVLVQFSGGYIEAHFHYFVVVALVALYEDYVPFLLAIGYVALDHGLIGSIAPDWVYNHEDAAAGPWKWAAIHAAAILAESAALLGFWAGAEQMRARSDVVLESTGEGMLGTDTRGTITFANPAAGAILGRDPDSLVGLPADQALAGVSTSLGARTGGGVFLARVPRATGTALVEWTINPTVRNGVVIGAVVALRDVTDRRQLEDQAIAHARQQAALARLSRSALERRELAAIFDDAVATVSSTLGVELCKVLELQPDGQRLLLRSGVGWSPGLVGSGTVLSTLESQAGYTLAAQAPVVVHDLRTETRFRGPALLHDHGVVSGLSTTITVSRKPWGVLGAHTREQRTFSADEVNFLQSVANLLASSIERHTAEQGLMTRNRQQAIVAALGHEALSGEGLERFLAHCARDVADALDVEFCKILELEPGGEHLLLRAGHGWKDGLVGHARVPADLHSQAGYALRHDGPVIVRDVNTETRFTDPALLKEHRVVSGMSVLIKGRDRPFGVLGAHSGRLREFTHDDIHFLQSVANLIATAIERHKVEDELAQHRLNLEGLVERRTAQLTEANRELEAFSYTVSHDLRSPLRSIDGFTRLLQQRYARELPAEARQLLDHVHDGAIRMGNLIESVLLLSRISRAELKQQRVDLSALAQRLLAEMQAQSPQRRVTVEVEPGLVATGDEGLLQLALQNLLSNAWKFTSRTEDARIAVRRGSAGDFVVEDNGAGFDMANAGELFQPFHRLHGANDFPGTGIGLATVSRIVHRHGGQVWAESRPGKGARFHFTLPGSLPLPARGDDRAIVRLKR